MLGVYGGQGKFTKVPLNPEWLAALRGKQENTGGGAGRVAEALVMHSWGALCACV